MKDLDLNLDLDGLSIDKMETLITELSQEIESRRAAEAEQVRKEIEKLLDHSGLSFHDVFRDKVSRKGRKVPMKYGNPDNPEQLWSGRGKMPLWMKEKVEAGAKKEDFLLETEE